MADESYNVFISWSGERSHQIAEALAWWLPRVMREVVPWISSRDIPKGAVWTGKIAQALSNCKIGIICLTSENLNAPWILFEAGALAKAVGTESYVCTYLFGLNPSDAPEPLGMFNHTVADPKDTTRLVKTISQALGTNRTDAEIEETVEVWWPRLDTKLDEIVLFPDDEPKAEREILEEILTLTRSIAANATRTSYGGLILDFSTKPGISPMISSREPPPLSSPEEVIREAQIKTFRNRPYPPPPADETEPEKT